MIDLWDFYIKDSLSKKLGIYVKYSDLINECGGCREDYTTFNIYDDEDAIQSFKRLIQPRNIIFKDEEIEFILLSYYLYKNDYIIKEFPNQLLRPKNLELFCEEVRKKTRETYGANNLGNITWENRRKVIDNLTFTKKDNTLVKSDINEIFKNISTRNTTFQNMEVDEKLQAICNAIENMLKINGSFITLDYNSYSLGYITDDIVKSFRKKTQCFRHADEQSIKERKSFTDIEKEFCINFGLTICNLIYKILSNTKTN